MKGTWRRLNGQKILEPLNQVVERILLEEKAKGHKIQVCIGTDSQVYGPETEYATVIVFRREKQGGFMFINSHTSKIRRGIKERLLNEVAMSIEVAYSLCATLEKCEVDLEVHADINTNPRFKSNVSLNEAMGYILGMGFVFRAKPDSFASTSCANKMV